MRWGMRSEDEADAARGQVGDTVLTPRDRADLAVFLLALFLEAVSS